MLCQKISYNDPPIQRSSLKLNHFDVFPSNPLATLKDDLYSLNHILSVPKESRFVVSFLSQLGLRSSEVNEIFIFPGCGPQIILRSPRSPTPLNFSKTWVSDLPEVNRIIILSRIWTSTSSKFLCYWLTLPQGAFVHHK